MLGIKRGCTCTDEVGKAFLCQGIARQYSSIDADGGFRNALQQNRLHSKANSMMTASAFRDPLPEEGAAVCERSMKLIFIFYFSTARGDAPTVAAYRPEYGEQTIFGPPFLGPSPSQG